ncbi:hypothetical protein ABZW18_04620 [Streptomyces sp. NPDC004647]
MLTVAPPRALVRVMLLVPVLEGQGYTLAEELFTLWGRSAGKALGRSDYP